MLTASNLNFKFSLINNILFPLLIVLFRFIPITADFSYVILAVYALFGRQQIIVALFLLWLFSLLNPELVPNTNNSSFSKYITILTCFLSILFRLNFAKIDKITIFTLGFVFFLIVHGYFFSQVTSLSILKALNWTVVTITLLLTWNEMNSSEHESTKNLITGFLLTIILICLALLLFTDLGYEVNVRYFHGILNHPQAFGLTVASLFILLLVQLFSHNRFKLIILINILICTFLVFVSGSRTSGLALILAILFFPILFSLLNIHKFKLFPYIFINKFFFIIASTLIVFMLIFNNTVLSVFSSFVIKTEKINFINLLSSYKVSRSVLYEPMIDNITQNPNIGIGFGIASDLSSMQIKYFKGIPVSAPTEKGVLPLLVLEEVGIYGFTIFIIWAFVLFRRANANGSGSFFILLTLFIFNLGEAGLFSPNGFGMLYLILLSSAVTKTKKSINY